MVWVPDIVCSHFPCDDGWIAKMIAYKFYDEKKLTIPEFVDGNYGNTDADYWIRTVRDKNVLVVDFSFKGKIRKAMETACKSMILLDHHASAKEEYGDEVIPLHTKDRSLSIANAEDLVKQNKIVMIMQDDQCGSSMTWSFFYPDIARPELIEYIEDQDLGKRKLPNATSFTYWMRSRLDYHNPENYAFLDSFEDEEDYKRAMEMGKNAYAYLHTALTQAVETVPVGTAILDGNEVLVGIGFAPYQFASEFANLIVEQRKVDAAIVFYHGANMSSGLSIRGAKKDGKDTNTAKTIASYFGGGGHNMAAGANFPTLTKGLDIIADIVETWEQKDD